MHSLFSTALLAVAASGLLADAVSHGAPTDVVPGGTPRLIAEVYDSQFPQAHDTYNGMGTGSDGRIYYVLSATEADRAARMFAFNPATRRVKFLGDLTEACGESGQKLIAQGKSHVNFVERQGKLYFATHVGHYDIIDGMERLPSPPPGFKPYPGGHILSYDMKTGRFEDFGVAPSREGLITFSMDTQRQRAYVLTWPTGRFARFDFPRREWKDFGTLIQPGEEGPGRKCHAICRSIVVSPGDGSAFFTLSTGDIVRYAYDRDALETVAAENLRKDYFGQYDPHSVGNMGYNWRQAFWCAKQKCLCGVHGNSGYLFRFDPSASRLEIVERLTSLPSRRSGMFDQFSYGYLGFALGPDQRTIYYLTGGPIYVDGKRVEGKKLSVSGEAKGLEDLHLVTYDLLSQQYRDRGAIFLPDGQRPTYVNSIAIGHDGAVYSMGRLKRNGRMVTDLFRVAPVGN
jgi:hypothetical protein